MMRIFGKPLRIVFVGRDVLFRGSMNGHEDATLHGAMQMLHWLAKRHVRLSLVTSAMACRHLLMTHKIDPEHAIYLGNTVGDFCAARSIGTSFVAVTESATARKLFLQNGVSETHIIPRLVDLYHKFDYPYVATA